MQILLKEAWPKGIFPMSMLQNHLKYTSTVTSGEEIIVKDNNSDVSLLVPNGIKGIFTQCVHTNLRPFETFVPRTECFISPVVEVHCKELSRTKSSMGASYCLQIPHCLKNFLYEIKVRCGDMSKSIPFVEVPHGQSITGRRGYLLYNG